MNKKILIADDVEVVLKLEEVLLKRTGCEIIRAKTGTEALRKIQEEKPRIALIDIFMPEMNGDAVCKFVKSNPELKDVRIIMVTSRGDKENEERCRRAGCDYFLTKPLHHTEFLEAVKRFLE